MDPSPSCGVNAAKGKGTMLGSSRDTSEKPESGIFIEELQKLLQQEGDRLRSGSSLSGARLLVKVDMEQKVEALKTYIHPNVNVVIYPYKEKNK
jgi:hypothetical protein